MSYLDRPLFHLTLIVVFGFVVGFLTKPATLILALRIISGGVVCVTIGFAIFTIQMGSVAQAFDVVTYLTTVPDKYGIGRLVAIGYSLIFSGVLVGVRAKLGQAPNPSHQSGRDEARR